MPALALLMCAVGCSTEGTLEVAFYGEDFIEEGIASDVTADGWSIGFDVFSLALRDVEIAGQQLPTPEMFDLTDPSDGAGQPVGELTLDAGTYRDATFTVDRMEVVGHASNGTDTKQFAWVFEEITRYRDCDPPARVTAGDVERFEITIHADHLFQDSLVADEPNVVFQPYADADRNGNGFIEIHELWETSIGTFDPGNATAPDLWTWLILAARTVGHVQGEGHCVSETILP